MGGSQSPSPAGSDSKLQPQWFYLELEFLKTFGKTAKTL